MFQPAGEVNEFNTQLIVSGLTVWLINTFKNVGAPVISKWFENNAKLISVVVSFLTAAGFTWAHEGSWMDGGKIIIMTPSVPTLITFCVHAFGGSFTQHYLYVMSKAVEQNKQILSSQEEFKLQAAATPVIAVVATESPK